MLQLSFPPLSSWEGKLFAGIIGFSWGTFIWEEYLSYRQRKVYREKVVPPKELNEIIDNETYEKARKYGLDKSKFGFYEEIFNQLLNTGIMVFGGIPALWRISGSLVKQIGYFGTSEIPQTLMFVTVGSTISFFLSLPWSAYFTFKVEQQHGFNKQTPGFFIKDKIKKFFVTELITVPIVSGLVYIIKAGGDYFFVYLWGFATVVMLFFMTVYPDYIAPLFDKYEPLPDGELKTRIEQLASELKFPLTKLYVVEGSKRSAHSNAYLYGFFKNKRIVLYDTLLEDYTPLNKQETASDSKENENSEASKSDEKEDKEEEQQLMEGKKKKTGCNNDEVMAVLGHELGHWKLNHVVKGIFISQVNMFLMFFGFGTLYRYSPLYRAFGFHKTQPAFIGFIIVMQFVFAPYSEVLGFFMTMFSRHNEFEADRFSCELGRGEKLKSALIKLNNDNLGFPVFDFLYSTWHHSHPPLLERIRSINSYAKKEK